jgi:DNA invertase Pin-like site-specific DNA recombinase
MARPAQGVKAAASKTIRCAIYTRKSSEDGLEQDFNSLDAQREACEAFIKSQKQEGWVALPALYDDGGLSGGDMERPALQRLLADIAAGLVDTVVVYKVDRLTRSLADFAKIVERFDAQGVAFVAVTQQFNTTTSMGRLTLNMLLSFAQFEREVTAERIRDKIAAAKKRGMWMGGKPPLGYDVKDKKLVVNGNEAETVRHIFRRYVALGSVHELQDELAGGGIRSKRRVDRYGRATGDQPIGRGALYRLLQNPIYRGEISHQGERHPGQHDPIVDEELWDHAQAALAGNRVARRTGRRARQPSLLAGLAFDDQGERLVPSHANKHGTRYRYYVSQPLLKGRRTQAARTGWRLPAGELEALIEGRLRELLADDAAIFEAIEDMVAELEDQRRLIAHAAVLAAGWPDLAPAAKIAILQALVHRVEVGRDKITIQLRSNWLAEIIAPDGPPVAAPTAIGDDQPILILTIPAKLARSGMAMTLLIEGRAPSPRQPDRSLLRLLAQAGRYRDLVLRNQGQNIAALANEAGVGSSYFTRILRLAFLAPEITQTILEGRQAPSLTAKHLALHTKLDPSWDRQRTQFGIT